MINFTKNVKNDVITILNLNGKPMVGSSACFSSDFEKAGNHIALFGAALGEVSASPVGLVEIKEVQGNVVGLVDGYEVIKFSHDKILGWHVGSSCALPAEIGKAKAYFDAMSKAYIKVNQKINKVKPIEPKYQFNVNEYSESAFGGMRNVVEGAINDSVVYTAKEFEGKWEFNVSGKMTDDFEWIEAFSSVVQKVNLKVKRQIGV